MVTYLQSVVKLKWHSYILNRHVPNFHTILQAGWLHQPPLHVGSLCSKNVCNQRKMVTPHNSLCFGVLPRDDHQAQWQVLLVRMEPPIMRICGAETRTTVHMYLACRQLNRDAPIIHSYRCLFNIWSLVLFHPLICLCGITYSWQYSLLFEVLPFYYLINCLYPQLSIWSKDHKSSVVKDGRCL